MNSGTGLPTACTATPHSKSAHQFQARERVSFAESMTFCGSARPTLAVAVQVAPDSNVESTSSTCNGAKGGGMGGHRSSAWRRRRHGRRRHRGVGFDEWRRVQAWTDRAYKAWWGAHLEVLVLWLEPAGHRLTVLEGA